MVLLMQDCMSRISHSMFLQALRVCVLKILYVHNEIQPELNIDESSNVKQHKAVPVINVTNTSTLPLDSLGCFFLNDVLAHPRQVLIQGSQILYHFINTQLNLLLFHVPESPELI